MPLIWNKKRGGKIIGQGTYGCVFNPPLKCDPKFQGNSNNSNSDNNGKRKKPSSKYIGKAMLDDDEYEAEKAIMAKVKAIDPNGDFTLGVEHSCQVTSVSSSDLSAPSRNCSKDSIMEKGQLIYKNGGVTLLDYIGTSPTRFFQVIKGFGNIIRGVQKIHDHGLFHGDIKPENILFSKEEKKMYLIDFGMSVSMNKVYEVVPGSFYTYMYASYIYFPPEFFWFHQMTNKRRVSVDSMIHNFEKSWVFGDIRDFNALCHMDIDSGITQFHAIMASMNNVLSQKLKPVFADKADVYELGMTLFVLIKRCYEYIKTQKHTLQLTLLKHIVANMANPNVFARWDMNQTISAWEEFENLL